MAVWSSLSQALVNSGLKRLLVSDAAKSLAKNGEYQVNIKHLDYIMAG